MLVTGYIFPYLELTLMKTNLGFYSLILATLIGLSATNGCKPKFPFRCTQDSDCAESAYCYQEVCIAASCEDDSRCSGGRTCVNSQCAPSSEVVPHNLIARPNTQQTTLHWDPVPNASSYKVYWKNSSGVSKNDKQVITCKTNELVHSNLENWKSYYYAVATVFSNGKESALSQEVWARPANLVPNGRIDAIARGDNGTVYIGGIFSKIGPACGAAVGWNAARKQLIPFPSVSGKVNAIVPDSSGGWYVGGKFAHIGGIALPNLAHVLADGTMDTDWKPDPDGEIHALFVNRDTIYVGGKFSSIGGYARRNLAAISTNGVLDQTWKSDTDGTVHALALSKDAKILYVGGEFSHVGGESRNKLAALTADGFLLTWKPDPNKTVRALAVGGDTLYVGGFFTNIGGEPMRNLAAINANGEVDLSWKPYPDPDPNVDTDKDSVNALVVRGDTLYVGGEFTSTDVVRSNLAAIGTNGIVKLWDPKINGNVNVLALSGDTLYVGGNFSNIGGESRNNLAAIKADGTVDLNVKPDPNGPVYALAVSGEDLYIGGVLHNIDEESVPRSNLAALKADGTLDLNWKFDTNRQVEALAVSGDTLYVGGRFTSIGGEARNGLAAIDGSTLNLNWKPIVRGKTAHVRSLLVNGETLYIGGDFTKIDEEPRNSLAAINADSTVDSNWKPESNGEIYALTALGETIYVGGEFSSIDGQSIKNLAAIGANGALDQNWKPDPNGVIYALAANRETIYVGGHFTSIGEESRKNFAAISTNGVLDQNWNFQFVGGIYALAIGENKVYAGGCFLFSESSTLVAIKADGSLDNNWKPESSSGCVNALAASRDAIYVGGAFESMCTNLGSDHCCFPQSHFARLSLR